MMRRDRTAMRRPLAAQRVSTGGPVTIERTMAALAFAWPEDADSGQKAAARLLRRRLDTLLIAGMHVGIVAKGPVDALGSLRTHAGRFYVGRDSAEDGVELFEIDALGRAHSRAVAGLAGAPDVMQALCERFDQLGVGPDLVLVCPDADMRTLLGLADEQLSRRRHRRVDSIDRDAAWTITETGRDPLRHRVTETLFTIGAAGVGTRGAVEEPSPDSVPMVLTAGVYVGTGPQQRLLPGPVWTGLSLSPPPVEDVRTLDLRTGVLLREEVAHDGVPLRTIRFASITRPGVVALRAEASDHRLRPGPAFVTTPGVALTHGRAAGHWWARAHGDGEIVACARQHVTREGRVRAVERLAAYVASPARRPRLSSAAALLSDADALGFDRLLVDQRARWSARWSAVNVSLPDDTATELAVRFALFHLWTLSGRHADELAVGARGVSGPGYAGHVFWDADVFVLPAVLAMNPRAARMMLRYRLRRLPAAVERARAAGSDGARFPWESAANGRDVTPVSVRVGGRLVRVRTGSLEEHVTADVAWAAMRCADWLGRPVRADSAVARLLVATARYWASRVRLDGNGSAHIDGVIGPDEYHEAVNDNAFTNVMARWNLRAAAQLIEQADAGSAEAFRWREVADALVDGYDAATGRYEQFAGYSLLEPLLVADYAAVPVAADVLLGSERIAASQVIKQPDVLMLHHLIPHEVTRGSLRPNLDYYAPRTAHGSSLSPAVMASLSACAGRGDDAIAMLRMATSVDLGDTSGMTAAGLHIANLAGTWLAMLHGFAGVRVKDHMLSIDPLLPTGWSGWEIRFRCLSRRVRIRVEPDSILVQSDRPLDVRRAGEPPRQVARDTRFARPRREGEAMSDA